MPWRPSGFHSTLGAVLVLSACVTPAPPEPEHVPRAHDPAIGELERIIARTEQGPVDGDIDRCVAAIDADGLCLPANSPSSRTIPIRIALDLRYQHWPDAGDRLVRTFRCVNRFFRATGIRWEVSSVEPWQIGEERHDLYALLARLQREMPADNQALRLGIAVWDERRTYSAAGGEIGLSQAGACVVPSWPRVENDCLILTHELGHLIGAKHVPGEHWVMGWAAQPFHLPAADPLKRVTAVYRFHPRNVAAITAYRFARLTLMGLRATRECGRRIRLIDRCYGLAPDD